MGTLHLAVFKICHLCVCSSVSAHHDDQQNVLEVVPEAQRVAAEQGKVSLQELGIKQRLKSNFR